MRKKHFFKFFSTVLIISIFVTCFNVMPVFAYGEDQYHLSGDYYYIKNVHSGKYLDVSGASSANGTNVLQWQFTGNTNQKWLVQYIGGGVYRIATALDTSKVLEIEDATGLNGKNARINQYSGAVKQKFAIVHQTDSTAHKLLSNASGYSSGLTVQHASCNNGANVFQYTYHGINADNTGGNADWLFEPVSYYSSTYGVEYAKAHYSGGYMTYPYIMSGGDCTNFVSQCLCAGGVHYTDVWYINKNNHNNHNNLFPSTTSELDASWKLHDPSPWISAPKFKTYWASRIYNETISVDNLYNNNYATSKVYREGDVIQIIKRRNGSSEAVHTMYITGVSNVITPAIK